MELELTQQKHTHQNSLNSQSYTLLKRPAMMNQSAKGICISKAFLLLAVVVAWMMREGEAMRGVRCRKASYLNKAREAGAG